MNAALELIRTLGAARLAAIGALSAVILGFAVFAFLRVSQPQMSTLFADLTYEDSVSIIGELEGMNIPYTARQDGAVILVPKEEVLSLRVRLAENGLPAGGGVGYEIFDKTDSLGATSFVQNLNHLRALEGELARTIRSIDRVKSARVHLVLPEQKLFAQEAAEPTASIMLKLRGSLGVSQIKAIQHIVASAVKDMKPERVSVVDDRGQLLASGSGATDGQVILSAVEERNRAIEDRLGREIEAIVGNVVGPNAVKVQVAAELDLSRSTETEDIFDPDGQVVRSSQSREESSAANDRAAGGGVSVGNELPGAGEAAGGGAATALETDSKTEEVVNYEISKRTRTQVHEAGQIKRLSVAVLVDGIYSQDADNKLVYAERPADQMEQITALVRSAMGFDRTRGDSLEVVNLRFAPGADAVEFGEGMESFFELTKDDYFRIAEMGVLGIVGLLVVFLIVRPLLRRALEPEDAGGLIADQSGEAATALTGPDGAVALPSPEDGQGDDNFAAAAGSVTELIESARMNGRMQESSIRKVAELVKGNPDEAIGIIRQWIQEPAVRT